MSYDVSLVCVLYFMAVGCGHFFHHTLMCLIDMILQVWKQQRGEPEKESTAGMDASALYILSDV